MDGPSVPLSLLRRYECVLPFRDPCPVDLPVVFFLTAACFPDAALLPAARFAPDAGLVSGAAPLTAASAAPSPAGAVLRDGGVWRCSLVSPRPMVTWHIRFCTRNARPIGAGRIRFRDGPPSTNAVWTNSRSTSSSGLLCRAAATAESRARPISSATTLWV